MSEDFEESARKYNYLTDKDADGYYTDSETRSIWNFYQIGYIAGRKAMADKLEKQVQTTATIACERANIEVEKFKLKAELAATKKALRVLAEEVERHSDWDSQSGIGEALDRAWIVIRVND